MSAPVQSSISNMAYQSQVRVIIADDHPIVRNGIRNELSEHPDIAVTGVAANGDEALELARTHSPDVLILDINMPGLRAVDILDQLTALPKPPRILVVTGFLDLEYILAMLKARVTGYLLKDEEPEMISTAVRAVAQGDTWLSPAVTAKLVAHTIRGQSEPSEPSLREREIEVMNLLGEGKSNLAIAEQLSISERTVRYHLRNIYGKLGVQRRGEAIAWWLRNYFGEERES